MSETLITTTVFYKHLAYIGALLLGIGLAPDVVGILTILVIMDVITGVLKTWRCNGGRSITSKMGSWGLLSKVLILGVPITIALMAKGLGMDLTSLVTGVMAMLLISETYSILGNIRAIKTGVEMKEFDVIGIIVDRIRDFFIQMSQGFGDKKE